ncbi:GNAT family N-acetyltransferase [Massilia niastensis]|uniref:GNAT family N-acetyltransferase n=1 Tax=Massilia niastensis TaxID=544911 RepID=UPI00035C6BEE|nr:GNAT family N-acetyltransferase [Massilia niastensis]
MKDEFAIAVESDVNPEDMDFIVAGLTDYNASRADGDTPRYLVVSVRDKEKDIVGGLVGSTYLGWLQVHVVWLPDALRAHGLGTSLMREAEQEALRRGCARAFLETFSFQALPFYEKLGYAIFSRLEGFPPGGARYALTKQLDRTGLPVC